MESEVLMVERRAETGRGAARGLRRKGLIPAVIYGHGGDAISLSVDEHAMSATLRSGTHVVTIELDGNEEQALIKEVQYDTFGDNVLHVDFARVALDERIVVELAIELHGDAKGARTGGVVDQPLHSVQIECLAASVPDNIRVEIGELEIGDSIHVKDLVVPENVSVLANPDEVVVVVHPPRKLEEVEVAAPEEVLGEPEVLTKKAGEEGEGEAEAEAKSS